MKISKKSLAIAMTVIFSCSQTAPFSVIASEITGVTGNNGVYNINPTALIKNTDIGYRKYKDFNLDKGDIANLIYKYGANDVNTFINLVDNRINVNGIVNTMRDGNFYNGRAVFVSPNGMIVGSSGVLNVGSLGVYTPTNEVYNRYKSNPGADLSVLQTSNNNGVVTINGKVIAANDIDIRTGSIDIPNAGNVIAGTGNNSAVVTNAQADTLFNSLVNTNNLKIADNVKTSNGKVTLTSTVGTNIAGYMENFGTGETVVDNSGVNGVKVSGKANSNGYMTIKNTGKDGILISSSGSVKGNNGILLDNNSTGGVKIQGKVSSENKFNNNDNITINSKNGNVVIGDNSKNDNYVTAGNNIKISTTNASILNYGVNKTLLTAGNDLTMNATDGTIGLEVGDTCTGGFCTGISSQPSTRDFTKSINANVGGVVNATTTDTDKAAKEEDFVINYAAFNSDMKIDKVKADGRVILTSDYGTDGTTRYDMINSSSNPDNANVEGWGISLISSGNIGEKNKPLTFNQTKPGTLRTTETYKNLTDGNGMDVLANENIYIKGLSDDYTVNNVCSMVSREGNIEAEFSGDTYIEETTSAHHLNLITRGKSMEINHLGTVPSLEPIGDYYGPYAHIPEEYDNSTPETAVVKALDINKNIRPNGEDVDGYYAWADSVVRINNALLEMKDDNPDTGRLDITADNIYANGIAAHFNKDGFSKVVDPSTNPVEGTQIIPTGHAVRPDDVISINRDEHERNYYYHEGDGDFTNPPEDYIPVDNNDGIVDATPLAIEPIKPGPEDKPDEPNDNPPTPNTNPTTDSEMDRKLTYKKETDSNVEAIDKRQYVRYNVANNANPVLIEQSNGVESLIDVSRGGISVTHNNELKVGDIIPVHISYGDLDINTDVKVVSASTTRAGAQFVNLNSNIANRLLYLNMLLASN